MPRRATSASGGGQVESNISKAAALATPREVSDAAGGGERVTRPEELAPREKEVGARIAVLLRLDDRGAGQLFELPRGRLHLGRSWEADVRVDEEAVSRRHAELTWRGDRLFVKDLGSTGGTYVDGARVSERVLRDGSQLDLGARVAFRVRLLSMRERDALFCLREQAMYDPLTRLYNRRYLTEFLAAEFAYASRHQTPLSVLVIDIDHFKQINDTHGHLAGDAVLQQVAAVAGGQVRTEDMLARYGGEEFVAVLRHTPVEGAAVLAERIRRSIEGRTFAMGFGGSDGGGISVTVSAGCASLSCHPGLSPNQLVGLADERLYRAKKEGRNRVMAEDPPGPAQEPRVGCAEGSEAARDAAPAPEGDEPPVGEAPRSEVVGRLARAYEDLDEQQQLIVGLYYQEDCCIEEISMILEIPAQQVEAVLRAGVSRVWHEARVAGAA